MNYLFAIDPCVRTKVLLLLIFSISAIGFVCVGAPAKAQSIKFDAGTNFSTSKQRPFIFENGDFNKDGNLDLVVALDFTGDAEVLFGDGSGGFNGSTVIPSGGAGTRAITVADFNNDSNLDIAVANSDSSNIKILFGSGSNTFSSGPTISTSTNPRGLLSADMNNDGNLDIVVSSITGNAIDIIAGNGQGGFNTPTSFAVGSRAERIESGDFNGDGNLDIVVTGPSVKLLLGDGIGNLGAATTVVSSRFEVGVADFNGDGKLDLVLGEPGVSVLFGTGTGSFNPIVTVTTGANDGIAISDLDNDGDLDVAATEFSLGTVVLLKNDGAGSFVTDSTLTASPGVLPIEVGDYDNNGFDDLVVGHILAPNDTRITVFKNITPPPTAPEIGIEGPDGSSIANGGEDVHGSQGVGSAVTQTYTVRNTGDATLDITNIATTSANNVTVSNLSATSLVVPAASVATFDVTYIATVSGAYSFELKISSNDSDEGSYNIKVSGTAVSSSCVFAGGGGAAEVNAFLTYAKPTKRRTRLPAGTKSYDIEICYGPTIKVNTFKANLNGSRIDSSFNPTPNSKETVTIPLENGRNALRLKVRGTRASGRTRRDRDALTFVVR